MLLSSLMIPDYSGHNAVTNKQQLSINYSTKESAKIFHINSLPLWYIIGILLGESISDYLIFDQSNFTRSMIFKYYSMSQENPLVFNMNIESNFLWHESWTS